MRRPIFICITLVLVLAACVAAPDEAWFRIIEIRSATVVTDEEGVETSGESQAVTVVEADLQSNSTDTVDVEVENYTVILGTSDGSGVGVDVFWAKVEYFYAGFSFPTYEYPVTLYLPAPGGGSAEGEGSSGSSGTLHGLPVAPVSLKGWLQDPANIPTDVLLAPLRVEARITLRASTDEGRSLETSSSISVVFQ